MNADAAAAKAKMVKRLGHCMLIVFPERYVCKVNVLECFDG